jgi:protein-serine/threonine kinase
VPSSSNGLDAVNFRHLKESNSLHLEDQMQGIAGLSIAPGTPGLTADDGMDLPPEGPDLFGAFSSVTLHYDGEG